jgi:hypothetical protein
MSQPPKVQSRVIEWDFVNEKKASVPYVLEIYIPKWNRYVKDLWGPIQDQRNKRDELIGYINVGV